MSTPREQLTRRHFLGTSSAIAGGLLLSGSNAFAAKSNDMSKYPSNDHFWYRRQPSGKFVDTQRDNKAFAYADGKIFLSEDNGHTWPHSCDFADARHIVFSSILKNGNILFSAMAKLYLSTDNLKTYKQITVKDIDGSDYVPHKPKNAERPGWYFHNLTGVDTFDVKGREMLVWGNYCNVIDGATPVNIYYSTDSGQTVKIAYSFGQNPFNQDDGSPSGGKTGTPLGNADNPVICRHVHCVTYNPTEDAFYACTGDFDRPQGHECHWLRGTYDSDNDKWDWKVIVSDEPNTRYKSCGINFVDGKLYWISDANIKKPFDRGVFCCDPADLPNREKHTCLYDPGVESGAMLIQDGVMLAAHCSPASPLSTGIIISTDMGKTWAQYDLKEFGRRSPCRINRMNGDGWFRLDLREHWVTPSEMFFIKPKKA
ncbi:MAG: twin-arginine translocation signal domain-containing protein [Pirellulales bacterium]|nr:twin-arginine translocation signal domain-containing protein [Pirellulales bacterium]